MPLLGSGRVEATLRLRPAMKQPVGGGAFRVRLPLRLLAGFPQTDKFAHWWEPSVIKYFGAVVAGRFCICEGAPPMPLDSED